MDEIIVWKNRIERALALQEQQHTSWEDAIALFNCEYFKKYFGNDLERVEVNFANWYVSLLVNLVYFRDPFIFVKPRHEHYDGFADTMERVLNYYWKELALKQEFKRVILSAFLCPPGWIKVGYTAKIGQDISKLDELKEKSIIQDLKNAILGKVFPKEEKTPYEQGIINEYIKEESVFASWIPSWNMLMPEGYHLISRMPYIIEIEDLPLVDFMANPLYKNKEQIKPNRQISESSSGKRLNKVKYNKLEGGDIEDEYEGVRLFHIWDKRSQKRLTVSMDSSKPHFESEYPYDLEGFPYEPLIFEETLPTLDKSNPYPNNVLLPIMPQIVEQTMMRTQMSKHRKRAAAYIMAQKGLLTEDDIKQLEEADDMQIVWVSNIAAVQAGTLPQLSPDIYNIKNIIDQDLQMATNMGQIMFQPQPGQRTATQARMAQSGLQLKSEARVDCIEDFTVKIARSLAQLLWQFCDREKISEIIGEPVTDSMWPSLPTNKTERRKIIQAELQFRIDAGSTAPPKDETIDRKQFIDAMSVAATIAPERLKKDEALRQLFKRFKYTPDLSKIVISNDEDEIMAANQENELLAGDVPQVVTPNENHVIHIQEHQKIPVPTKSSDLHISDHGKFLGITQQSGVSDKPQEGDKRPPMKSQNPEIVRGGITNEGDIAQDVENLGVGTGAEAM